MSSSNILILIGLLFNTLASLVMLYPHLNIWRNVEDECILKMNKDGKYTQKKHRQGQKFSIVGLILFTIGFIFQIIGIFIL